ncbi:permease [Propionivibrio sp.]|uniref:permease n=1 Tax=Propionivibrio sp. TaxID=2212460 RepID=UPI0025EE3E1B|nr:permease [Propionivibrio sp.]MBK7355594.1 permease [Propionivibrio sp.]MBK8400736.1 permease [Propionivibrio sp.]MBK8744767.1 permease [Propionivibrio sp.]MBK8893259.1 permease [Propionivibrio sp.]MBL0207769.1 permease [Propionivibrio sp.]
MKNGRLIKALPSMVLILAVLLTACATPPSPTPEQRASVDESAMLPLLGHIQLLHRMSPSDLSRERAVLAVKQQTPATQVRMAALLSQQRPSMDLVRALSLLESVLKSTEPEAVSLHPLARILANHFQERLKLEQQNEKLVQQLKDSQRRGSELQDKLDALADIERSLPARPTAGDTLPGAAR